MQLRAVASDMLDVRGQASGDSAARRPTPPAVLRAVEIIHERYYEQLTLTGLASEVYVSPFHFSRIFAKATGVTPGRFITAVRLFEAKRLLLTTSLTVADIVCSVGYSSVGTFTSRFTKAVGMTPTKYRDPAVGELLVAIAPHLTRMPPLRVLKEAGRSCAQNHAGSGTLTVKISMPSDVPPAEVLVGLFADPIPQRGPVAAAGLVSARDGDIVTLRGVPDGTWSAMAIAEHGAGTGASTFTIGTQYDSVLVTPHSHSFITLGLRTPNSTDAPVAITLASLPGLPGTRRVAEPTRKAA